MELSKTKVKKIYGALAVLFFMLVIVAFPMKNVEAAVAPGTITIEGNVTPKAYNDLMYYVNLMDKYDTALLKSFSDNGWKIVLTANDLNTTLFNGTQPGMMGYTDFGKKTIYVQAGSYEYCVIHEMGHYLDYLNGYTSNTPNFMLLYNTERGNLSQYGFVSPSEFFAEVYMYQYLNPTKATTGCPYSSMYVNYLRTMPTANGWYM